MSLNKLLGGDCGGNNTLVQLSSMIVRDTVPPAQPHNQADMFVNEFMGQQSQSPHTFNMKTLLNSVSEIETNTTMRLPKNDVTQFTGHSTPWTSGPSTSYIPQLPMMRPMHVPSLPLTTYSPANVQIEYINEHDLQVSDNDVKAKAKEYIEAVKDDEDLAYNQFMSFMKKINAGEINLGDAIPNDQKQLSKDEMLEEMAEKYKEEWAKLSDVTDILNSEVANGISKDYNFSEGNIMLENKNALEIGKEKLKMGDIPGAVLCFEAAVQQQFDSAEAWFLLGSTQAENEQDPLAITALKKSLEIDPRQSEAYITLAATYTNENLPKHAMLALYDWLKASPNYSDLLPQDIDPQKLEMKELESYVKDLYLKAAQLHPEQVDPDVQNALGVAFNVSQEYDKAVDCFRTALLVADHDSKLWNRLGATLANSDRSEEAVEAYHRALNLEPGYIRARYNVGITCMNLGAHREAAEHFLVALNQQYKAQSLQPTSSVSDNSSSTIWTTLRMVCSFMGEHDIAKFVDEKNLNELNKFFEVE